MLVIIGFVCNFKNGVKENRSKFITAFTLSFFAEYPHILVPLLEHLNVMIHLLLHGPEHLLFAPLCSLCVNLASLLVASLPELPIIDDDVLALLGPPLLIVELLLLLGLALHALENLVLTALVLHVLVSLHLVHDHLSPPSLAVPALTLTDNLLVLGPEAGSGQGQGRSVKVNGLGRCLDALGEWVGQHGVSFAGH